MGKLDKLTKAASEYFGIPLDKLKSPCRHSFCTKPRHNCQWIASDAGYSKAVIAKHWNVNRSSVYYGVRIVSKRIKGNDYEKEELSKFMQFLNGRI